MSILVYYKKINEYLRYCYVIVVLKMYCLFFKIVTIIRQTMILLLNKTKLQHLNIFIKYNINIKLAIIIFI